MTRFAGKLAALMLIGVLVSYVAATPAFADWDRTNYPAIQGTQEESTHLKDSMYR